MADLKTTYQDDVLDTSVNEKRKYNMIQNADGTVSFEDVTTYSQNGDSFGAADINATNAKVNEVNSNLSNLLTPTTIGEANPSISGYATINDINSKIKNLLICTVNAGNNIVTFHIPKYLLNASLSIPIYFRDGNSTCDVRVAYVGTVNGGQIQLTNVTIDGIDYKTNSDVVFNISTF